MESTETIAVIKSDEAIFEQYESVRWQLIELEAMRRELEPEMTQRGLDIYQATHRKTVYNSKTCSIQVRFQPQVADSTKEKLKYLDECIQSERDNAIDANRQLLDEIAVEMAKLTSLQDQLSQTETGLELIAEKQKLLEQERVKTPIIVFKTK